MYAGTIIFKEQAMQYPELNRIPGQRLWTEQFLGLDRRARAQDGTFAEMRNMSGGDFPLLETRARRGLVATLEEPQGVIALNGLAWVDDGTLYYNGSATAITGLSSGEKQLVAMGAYILIFPDGVYYNTVNAQDSGAINRLYQSAQGGSVAFTLCTMDGVDYPREGMTVGPSAPENPDDGDYWIDTSGETHGLYQWREVYKEWTGISSVYVKIAATGIGQGLNTQDSVKLSGITYTGEDADLKQQIEFLNETHIIQAVGNDFLVVIGVIDQNYTMAGQIRADRKLPEMDYIFECNNRLWGCHYGTQDGETVNRIYASALGDFKNFSKFGGTSQDSYFVAVGSEGPFTGGIAHRGYPYFFKSNCVHKVYGDRPSNYEMQTTICDGVKAGSGKTLISMNGALYYLGEHGTMYFESLPEKNGEALGDAPLSLGAAGGNDGKWYLSVREAAGTYSLYVLDTARGLWHREDESQALGFAAMNGEIYMLCADGNLYALNGTAGTLEGAGIQWQADTAMIGFEYPDHKYLGRYTLRIQLETGASCEVFLQYDSDGVWRSKGVLFATGRVKTCLLPIVPRRCEHMQIRIRGQGGMKLYGIARTLYMGSDGRG